MTKMVFRKWKGGEVIALFPHKQWNRHGLTATFYMHVDQHATADYADKTETQSE